ncbi:MAG: GNAT family N-acetyltransferase [Microthrixaceae bacterium]
MAAVSTVYPVEIFGERIVLREVLENDVDAAFTWGSDPEFFRYLPYEPVQTLEEEREYIAGVINTARQTPRVAYQVGIELCATQQLVGFVDLRITSFRHRNAELGLSVTPPMWGQGLATESARLLIQFGFERLGLHRISAGHHPDNVGSGRVLERVGMRREGHLRENLLCGGEWRDSIVYSILGHEI